MYGIPRASAVVGRSNPLVRSSYKLEVIKDDRHITKVMDGYKKKSMIMCTEEVDDQAAIGAASGGVAEEGLAVGEATDGGVGIGVDQIAGVDEGVAEAVYGVIAA